VKRTVALMLLMTAGSFLSACSQETDIWLYKDEQWKITVAASFDPDAMPTIGLSADIVPGFSIGTDVSTYNEAWVDAAMEQLTAQYESMGVDARWRKSRRGKDVVYTVEIKGQGWNRLSQVAIGEPSQQGQSTQASLSVTNLGSDQLRFLLSVPVDSSGLGMMVPQTYRLHGSKIISTNAPKRQGSTAIWRVPQGPMEAVITPASEFDLGNPVVLAVAAGGVLVVGGTTLIYFLLLRPSSMPRRPGIGLTTHRPTSLYRVQRPRSQRRRW